MSERSRPLDGIRGLAILAVMANHTGVPLARGGYLGVDLFFVLSGYLIMSILLRERDRAGGTSFRRFYARRALRLYPALLVTCLLAIAFAKDVGFTSTRQAVIGALTAVTYLQDVAVNGGWTTGAGLFHTWTLAIEEQFYLVWPPLLVLLLIAGHARFRWVLTVLVAGIAGSVAILVLAFEPSTSPTSAVYYRPDARAGALLVGCLLAVLLSRFRTPMPAPLGWLVLVAFVGTCMAAPEANRRVAFIVAIPMVWLASAVLVTDLVLDPARPLGRLLGWRPLALVGLISYGLYLYHPLAFHAVSRETGWARHQAAPVAIAIAFVVAASSYRWIELPFLRLKRQFRSAGDDAPLRSARVVQEAEQ